MRPGSDPKAVKTNSTAGNESILANPCYLMVSNSAADDVSLQNYTYGCLECDISILCVNQDNFFSKQLTKCIQLTVDLN